MKDDLSAQLTPDMMLQAYAAGIFPMAEGRDDPRLFWVDPRHRGVVPLNGFHISRSLARRLRRDDYRVTLNHGFDDVVHACAARPETWINDPLRRLYSALHDMGHAHSIEVHGPDGLIGGVFGLTIGGAFFGESMFSAARDGSKIALAYLTDHLRACGFSLFDTQFITPHLASLGAVEIPRADYRRRLSRAINRTARFGAAALPATGYGLLQRNTQTSYRG